MATKLTAGKIEEVARELAEAEAALALAEEEYETTLREVAADLAVGAISPGDAAARTNPSEETVDRARTLVLRHSRALPTLTTRLAAQEAEEQAKAAAMHAKAVTAACSAANECCQKLGEHLLEADRAARGLRTLRDTVDRLCDPDPAEARGGGGLLSPATPRRAAPAPPPGWVDEPAWGAGLATLRELLESGPRRPEAEAEAKVESRAAEQAAQREEVLAWIRVDPVRRARRIIAGVDTPEELRLQAEAILDEALAARDQADELPPDDGDPVQQPETLEAA